MLPNAKTSLSSLRQEELESQITEAMGESGYGGDEKTATAFIDYIARRSGLLLPPRLLTWSC